MAASGCFHREAWAWSSPVGVKLHHSDLGRGLRDPPQGGQLQKSQKGGKVVQPRVPISSWRTCSVPQGCGDLSHLGRGPLRKNHDFGASSAFEMVELNFGFYCGRNRLRARGEPCGQSGSRSVVGPRPALFPPPHLASLDRGEGAKIGRVWCLSLPSRAVSWRL